MQTTGTMERGAGTVLQTWSAPVRRQEAKTMKSLKHWQDPVHAVLGAGLVLAPWAVGFAGDTVATVNAVVAGLALVAGALGAMLMPRAWEEWTEAVLGLWLIVSPWALGFSAQADARRATVVTGIAVVVLAAWTLATDKDYRAWLRDRLAL
jgi:SPW repeat